jgi:hypothetical protein
LLIGDKKINNLIFFIIFHYSRRVIGVWVMACKNRMCSMHFSLSRKRQNKSTIMRGALHKARRYRRKMQILRPLDAKTRSAKTIIIVGAPHKHSRRVQEHRAHCSMQRVQCQKWADFLCFVRREQNTHCVCVPTDSNTLAIFIYRAYLLPVS